MGRIESSDHALITGFVIGALHDSAGRAMVGWRIRVEADDDGNYTDTAMIELPTGGRYLVIVRPVDDDEGPVVTLGHLRALMLKHHGDYQAACAEIEAGR
jgi:hypothetical protein